ncbi:Hexapeptide repeat of succinyl-transferase [Maribacter aquivivus]|uniref:Hexapeptide repeat of succinyl-transferase n=1 Tax=Maribacter aquivivus TaxID=228958 RepID=A0A1M6LHU4_9FLAO|nr:acyltransferase [Maribacter aquivivus]SHJ70772.1 Hexapeptide repeat of succinyl-transferase [Maribacter aquivivus]
MLKKFLIKYFIFRNKILFKKKGISHGKHLMVMGPIQLLVMGELKVGNHFNMISGIMTNALGRNLKSTLRVDLGAKIIIGDNVGMSCVSIWSKEEIIIGDNVKLGANVIVFDSDMHSLDYQLRRDISTDGINSKSSPIVIEDDVFIGANSIITKGVKIGRQAIIAAGSVVVKSIPERQTWGGNPARFIKENTK